jgi:hypothetical protein
MVSVIHCTKTVMVSVRHNVRKFSDLRMRSNCMLSVWSLKLLTTYSNQELADMHFVYVLEDSNAPMIRHLY